VICPASAAARASDSIEASKLEIDNIEDLDEAIVENQRKKLGMHVWFTTL
jgi:hypothetical protein